MELVLCCPTTTGHGACPGAWLIYSVTLHWKNSFSLSQWVSIANSFLVGLWPFWLLPSLNSEAFSGLDLCKSCVCCHSLYGFTCVSVLLCVSGRHLFLGASHQLWHMDLAIIFEVRHSSLYHMLFPHRVK